MRAYRAECCFQSGRLFYRKAKQQPQSNEKPHKLAGWQGPLGALVGATAAMVGGRVRPVQGREQHRPLELSMMMATFSICLTSVAAASCT